MSTARTAAERIVEEVTSWPGVEARPGAFGSLAFYLERREIGHLHGDRVAHFAFPRGVRAELLAEGRVVPHPVASPGLAARAIDEDGDVEEVIALLRLNYDRLAARHAVPAGA